MTICAWGPLHGPPQSFLSGATAQRRVHVRQRTQRFQAQENFSPCRRVLTFLSLKVSSQVLLDIPSFWSRQRASSLPMSTLGRPTHVNIQVPVFSRPLVRDFVWVSLWLRLQLRPCWQQMRRFGCCSRSQSALQVPLSGVIAFFLGQGASCLPLPL